MPRYDYQCKQCGNKFELKQGFDADPVADCSECGGESTRVIYSVPVVFKGSGFYVNDYGRGNGSKSSSQSDEEKAEKKAEKADKSDKKTKTESSTSEKKSDSSKKKEPAGKKD